MEVSYFVPLALSQLPPSFVIRVIAFKNIIVPYEYGVILKKQFGDYM